MIFSTLFSSFFLESLPAAELGTSISLKSKKVQITVDYPVNPENDPFARYALTKTADFLPAVEKYLDIPFPGLDAFRILICEKCGSMDEKTVKIAPGKNNAPALLYHELGHFWYGYAPGHTKREWLIEGIVSFLPMAMHETGFITMNLDERDDLIEGWMFNTVVPKNDDKAMASWHGDYFHRYAKSYKIQYLISRELGKEKYRSFLNSVIIEKPQNDAAILMLLKKHKPMDWHAFLSGWVFPGEYKNIKMDDFGDQDLDGLLNIEERYTGTSSEIADSDGDGYADGWEWKNGYDPKNKLSPSEMEFPVVDGCKDAIKKSTVFSITDQKDDATASSDISILEVHIIKNSPHNIFLRTEFYKNEKRPSFHTVRLRSEDGRNFWIQTKSPVRGVWISEFSDDLPFEKWKTSKIDVKKIAVTYSDVFELSFSSDDFGLKNSFTIRYIAGGYTNGKEKWDSDMTEFLQVKLDK